MSRFCQQNAGSRNTHDCALLSGSPVAVILSVENAASEATERKKLIVDPKLFFEQGVEFWLLDLGVSTFADLSLGYFGSAIFNVYLVSN